MIEEHRDAPPESNGRATIREVHALLTETRHETEQQLGHMEERLTAAIYSTEGRVLDSVNNLGKRVETLEDWRDTVEHDKTVQAAVHDGRWWFPNMVMIWIEQHWKVLAVIVFIIITIITVVADIDIHLIGQEP